MRLMKKPRPCDRIRSMKVNHLVAALAALLYWGRAGPRRMVELPLRSASRCGRRRRQPADDRVGDERDRPQ